MRFDVEIRWNTTNLPQSWISKALRFDVEIRWNTTIVKYNRRRLQLRFDVEIGWGDVHGDILGQFDPNPTEQVYEMETNGSLTIRKYSHNVKRDVEGRVWFDGSRVNAWWNDFL